MSERNSRRGKSFQRENKGRGSERVGAFGQFLKRKEREPVREEKRDVKTKNIKKKALFFKH